MATYYPIIVDTANQRLKELPSGDTLDLTNSRVQSSNLELGGAIYSTINTSSTTVYDLSYSSFFQVELNGNLTITSITGASGIANVAQSFMIEFNNNASYGVSWPASVKWDSGITPSIAANKRSLVSLLTTDGGTTFRGNVILTTAP